MIRTIIDRAALGYNRVEIEDFTQVNPDSIYHAVLRGIGYGFVFDPNRNPTAIAIPRRC